MIVAGAELVRSLNDGVGRIIQIAPERYGKRVDCTTDRCQDQGQHDRVLNSRWTIFFVPQAAAKATDSSKDDHIGDQSSGGLS